MRLQDLLPDIVFGLQAFVTVLMVMDPFGTVPVFLSLTQRESPTQRRRVARQASVVAGGVVAVFALAGQSLLSLLGISLQSLQVAGGLLLALIALDLLRTDCGAHHRDEGDGSVAFVPLGTPLLAGPGAIAATMLYVERARGPASLLGVAVALAAAVAISYLVLRYAATIGRVLKVNGLNLVVRLVGLLVAAIAVQLIAGGISHWLEAGTVA